VCMQCKARLLVEVTSKICSILEGNTRHVRKGVRNKNGKVNGLKSKRMLGYSNDGGWNGKWSLQQSSEHAA
jgi:hypothetical protein